MKKLFCYFLLVSMLFLSGCNAINNGTKSCFPSKSIINSSSIVSISEEQIQEINDLLYVAGYNNPDNGYYNNIQTIAPNDKLIEFNVNILNDENDFRYNGKYGLNIYRCGNEYCVFVYSASYVDDNIFLDKNRCLGYLLFDTVIEYKKLMNAKSIDIISKYDSNFTINNRGKYNNSVDLLFRRIGQSFEYEDSQHALFLTDDGFFAVSYEKDEMDSNMNLVPNKNAKIINIQEFQHPVFDEVYKLILPE